MALSLITRVGEVVAPPPSALSGNMLRLIVGNINIGAITDYTVGTGFTNTILTAALGVNSVVWASGAVSAEGTSVPRAWIPVWQTQTGVGGLLFYEALADEIEQADITAGDNLYIVAVCI